VQDGSGESSRNHTRSKVIKDTHPIVLRTPSHQVAADVAVYN
jgi:hypothetical protein